MRRGLQGCLPYFDRFNVAVYASFLCVLLFDRLAEDVVKKNGCETTGNMTRDVPKWLFLSLSPLLFLLLIKWRSRLSEHHVDIASDTGETIDVSLFLVNVVKEKSNFIPDAVFYGASVFVATPIIMRVVKCQYPQLVRGTRRQLSSALAEARLKKCAAISLSVFEVGLHFLGGYAGACLVLDQMVDVFWSTEHNSSYPSKSGFQVGLLASSLLLSLLALEFEAALTCLRWFKGSVGVFYAYSMTPLSIMACLTNLMTPAGFLTLGLPVSVITLFVSGLLAIRSGYQHARFPWAKEDNRSAMLQNAQHGVNEGCTVLSRCCKRVKRVMCEKESVSYPSLLK